MHYLKIGGHNDVDMVKNKLNSWGNSQKMRVAFLLLTGIDEEKSRMYLNRTATLPQRILGFGYEDRG